MYQFFLKSKVGPKCARSHIEYSICSFTAQLTLIRWQRQEQLRTRHASLICHWHPGWWWSNFDPPNATMEDVTLWLVMHNSVSVLVLVFRSTGLCFHRCSWHQAYLAVALRPLPDPLWWERRQWLLLVLSSHTLCQRCCLQNSCIKQCPLHLTKMSLEPNLFLFCHETLAWIVHD